MENRLIENGKGFISIMGSGGKTTFLIEFGSYLKSRGYSVLLTTSTKLSSPKYQDYKCDNYFLDDSVLSYYPKKGETILYGHFDKERNKVIAPNEEIIEELYKHYDVILVEADGSKKLPLKIHTERDPVIWKETTRVVSLVGMWAFGEMSESVAFGEEAGIKIDKDYFVSYLKRKEGPTKRMLKNGNILLFNGADRVSKEILSFFQSLDIPNNIQAFVVSLKEGMIYENF